MLKTHRRQTQHWQQLQVLNEGYLEIDGSASCARATLQDAHPFNIESQGQDTLLQKMEKVLVLVACFVQSSSAAVAALPRRVRIEGQHFVEAATSQTIVLAGNDA